MDLQLCVVQTLRAQFAINPWACPPSTVIVRSEQDLYIAPAPLEVCDAAFSYRQDGSEMDKLEHGVLKYTWMWTYTLQVLFFLSVGPCSNASSKSYCRK